MKQKTKRVGKPRLIEGEQSILINFWLPESVVKWLRRKKNYSFWLREVIGKEQKLEQQKTNTSRLP